ncbi:YnfU family zinc-binding protein [Apirhabdus apintestini]|nr:YnfU family zinc-binding protein [Enterobacteriaceae bacterium CA-0114]
MLNKRKDGPKSFLVSVSCPQCAKKSEHSKARVNKNKKLICPFCNTLFLSNSPASSSPANFSLRK